VENHKQWKTRAIIIGGVVGLIAGIVASLIFIQRAEQIEAHPKVTAKDGVMVGIGVLGVLRSIADLATKK
jgi:hypothetical protein